MPSRIVKGHSRIVVLQNATIGLFPMVDGKIHVTRKTRDGKIFYLATLSQTEALALEAAINDMILELEGIQTKKRVDPLPAPNEH